jgi:hypothetical protein
MKTPPFIALGVSLVCATSALAINAKYAKQLERSGCTQMSEQQGCDISKSKAENAKAGFVSEAPASAAAASNQTPYAGNWVAKNTNGAIVATIRIDNRERAWVNGKPVKAKRSDGALVFRVGPVLYAIQGDRRLVNEDSWTDFDAGTKGPIASH